MVPVGLIAKQPDLGTAVLVFAAGLFVIYFAGLSFKLIVPVLMAGVIAVACDRRVPGQDLSAGSATGR